MTDQSIEDASRKEFEIWYKREGFHVPVEEAYTAWEAWQAARQSSQSEPVASIVQEIFDLCIQYERSCYNTGYLHLAEKLLVLAGRANSAIKIMEQTIAAPQQAIPSERIAKLEKAINYLLANDLLANSHARAVANTALLSASPTAPIERDK
jgi:hypothetical protein